MFTQNLEIEIPVLCTVKNVALIPSQTISDLIKEILSDFCITDISSWDLYAVSKDCDILNKNSKCSTLIFSEYRSIYLLNQEYIKLKVFYRGKVLPLFYNNDCGLSSTLPYAMKCINHEKNLNIFSFYCPLTLSFLSLDKKIENNGIILKENENEEVHFFFNCSKMVHLDADSLPIATLSKLILTDSMKAVLESVRYAQTNLQIIELNSSIINDYITACVCENFMFLPNIAFSILTATLYYLKTPIIPQYLHSKVDEVSSISDIIEKLKLIHAILSYIPFFKHLILCELCQCFCTSKAYFALKERDDIIEMLVYFLFKSNELERYRDFVLFLVCYSMFFFGFDNQECYLIENELYIIEMKTVYNNKEKVEITVEKEQLFDFNCRICKKADFQLFSEPEEETVCLKDAVEDLNKEISCVQSEFRETYGTIRNLRNQASSTSRPRKENEL